MKRATEIYAREFDFVFLDLAPRLRELLEAKIHDLGSRLTTYAHHRLKGRSEYRLRVGDYRIIYGFDQEKNILYLVASARSLPLSGSVAPPLWRIPTTAPSGWE